MVPEAEFRRALRNIPKPSVQMLQVLKAHVGAKNHVSTASLLAQTAGYQNWRLINLQYGLLGKRIGKALGRQHESLSFLVEFSRPQEGSNKELLLLMKPAFAKSLKKENWV